MRLLFSHVNYPSQFRRLLPYLISRGQKLYLFAEIMNGTLQIDGVRILTYQNHGHQVLLTAIHTFAD